MNANYKPLDYFYETCEYEKFDRLSDERINELIDKLLLVLPNNGHLYKYRSFKTDNFDLHLNSYKDGYLYLPTANTLNDKIDCSFNYKELRTSKEILEYILENKYRIHYINLKATDNKKLKVNLNEKLDVLASLHFYDDEVRAAKCLKDKAIPFLQKLQFVKQVKKEVDSYVCSEEFLSETIEKYDNLGKMMQETIKVFSFCESCEQDSMWAYYSSDNNGYCIEYDLNKIKKMDRNLKIKLIPIYKVIYDNQRDPIDPFNLYEVGIFDKTNHKKLIDVNKHILKSFITKSLSWEHEKEWRLLSMDKEQVLYADLIYGFIIDEDELENEKAKMLIKLANDKNYVVKVRHLNKRTNTFEIKNLEQ